MTFLFRPADLRTSWAPIPGLPEVWCATLETAHLPDGGLSAILHCVRPNETKVSIRIHLHFGHVLACWSTEQIIDPWQDDVWALFPMAHPPRSCPPLQEISPSAWIKAIADDPTHQSGASKWRHFEIASSDTVLHVISAGKLQAASFVEV